MERQSVSLALFLLDHGRVAPQKSPSCEVVGIQARPMPRTPITSLNCWRPRRVGAGLSMEARHVALLAHPHAAPPALLADEWIIAVRREDGTGLAREIAAAVKVAHRWWRSWVCQLLLHCSP